MPIEFQCSSCASPLRVPDEFAGRTAKCPKCSNLNAIPNHSETRESSTSQVQTGLAPKGDSNPYSSELVSVPKSVNSYRGSLVLRSVDVGSAAMMSGGINALIGLIIGFIWAGFIGLAAVLGAGAGQAPEAIGFGMGMGLGVVIFAPVMYGMTGLVIGALCAISFNIVAKFVGGLRFETS